MSWLSRLFNWVGAKHVNQSEQASSSSKTTSWSFFSLFKKNEPDYTQLSTIKNELQEINQTTFWRQSSLSARIKHVWAKNQVLEGSKLDNPELMELFSISKGLKQKEDELFKFWNSGFLGKLSPAQPTSEIKQMQKWALEKRTLGEELSKEQKEQFANDLLDYLEIPNLSNELKASLIDIIGNLELNDFRCFWNGVKDEAQKSNLEAVVKAIITDFILKKLNLNAQNELLKEKIKGLNFSQTEDLWKKVRGLTEGEISELDIQSTVKEVIANDFLNKAKIKTLNGNTRPELLKKIKILSFEEIESLWEEVFCRNLGINEALKGLESINQNDLTVQYGQSSESPSSIADLSAPPKEKAPILPICVISNRDSFDYNRCFLNAPFQLLMRLPELRSCLKDLLENNFDVIETYALDQKYDTKNLQYAYSGLLQAIRAYEAGKEGVNLTCLRNLFDDSAREAGKYGEAEEVLSKIFAPFMQIPSLRDALPQLVKRTYLQRCNDKDLTERKDENGAVYKIQKEGDDKEFYSESEGSLIIQRPPNESISNFFDQHEYKDSKQSETGGLFCDESGLNVPCKGISGQTTLGNNPNHLIFNIPKSQVRPLIPLEIEVPRVDGKPLKYQLVGAVLHLGDRLGAVLHLGDHYVSIIKDQEENYQYVDDLKLELQEANGEHFQSMQNNATLVAYELVES